MPEEFEYPLARPTLAYQYDQAIDADWVGEWSHPYTDRLGEAAQLGEADRERFLAENRSPVSNLGPTLGKWKVRCRRVSCGKTVQGDVDTLVLLVESARNAGLSRVTLNAASLAQVRSAVRRPVDLSGD